MSSENKKSDSKYVEEYMPYNGKKGAGFGAFAGFISAVAFSGIIMSLSVLFDYPAGTIMYSLGLPLSEIVNVNDPIRIGIIGFALILIKGIIIGILFGIITSKSKRLYPSSRKKGVSLGLLTGFIAFLVAYVPAILLVYPQMLSEALDTYPPSLLSTKGLTDYNLSFPPTSLYLQNLLGFGLVAYLVYGFFIGGIVTLAYSVYHFNLRNIIYEAKEKDKEETETGNEIGIRCPKCKNTMTKDIKFCNYCGTSLLI